MKKMLAVLVLVSAFSACTSVGNLGIIAKSRADMASILRSGQTFQELGPVEGTACRHFFFGIAPWGNADIQKATDRALEKGGGDAIINVTTTNSLYGFIPMYSIYSFTCTTVRGTAIKLQKNS